VGGKKTKLPTAGGQGMPQRRAKNNRKRVLGRAAERDAGRNRSARAAQGKKYKMEQKIKRQLWRTKNEKVGKPSPMNGRPFRKKRWPGFRDTLTGPQGPPARKTIRALGGTKGSGTVQPVKEAEFRDR